MYIFENYIFICNNSTSYSWGNDHTLIYLTVTVKIVS